MNRQTATQERERSGLAIVEELLYVTRRMAESDDLDFIVEAIDRRGELMDEYDRLKATNRYFAEAAEKGRPQIRKLVAEIMKLDDIINKKLVEFRESNKQDLQGSVAKNRVLKYTNSAISAAGSYMDVKK
jgi:phage host-nuclease inhibitor protein Gam